jgi:ABC-type transport system involved in multi-copper enzyme maturation permease subunit
MKFLAMLRDSLRETLDVKLFYVMVGLSLLVLLLVASVVYKPVTIERYLRFTTGLLNKAIQADPNSAKFNFRIDYENFQRKDGGSESEPWLGDYEFDYVIEIGVREGMEIDPLERRQLDKARKDIKQAVDDPSALERQLGQLFKKVEVVKVPTRKDLPPDTDETRFHITTHGTRIQSRMDWFHEPALFFGAVNIPVPLFSLGGIIRFIGDYIIGGFGAAFVIFISIIITASFLPSMLGKGTIDMLLVKPINRPKLFVYKFLGGLLFMFLNTVLIMVGLWLILGLRTGAWINSLLLCIPVYTFQFMLFYSVSALMAVLTRSTLVCILVCFMTWGFMFGLGWAHWLFIENRRTTADEETRTHWAFVGFDVAYSVLPRYKDFDWLTSRQIEEDVARPRRDPLSPDADAEDREAYERRNKQIQEAYKDQLKKIDKKYGSYTWVGSLTVTGVWIVLVLGLSCWLFSVKDY